eukprot:1197082-Amphidinium_carterae.1
MSIFEKPSRRKRRRKRKPLATFVPIRSLALRMSGHASALLHQMWYCSDFRVHAVNPYKCGTPTDLQTNCT